MRSILFAGVRRGFALDERNQMMASVVVSSIVRCG
jgi:hypothetical protein